MNLIYEQLNLCLRELWDGRWFILAFVLGGVFNEVIR